MSQSDKPFSNSKVLRLFSQQTLANHIARELNIVTSSFCHLVQGLFQDLRGTSWKALPVAVALEDPLEVKGSPGES